ncbi:hypothetical protein A4H97_24095 [Niastella yeongjuensis]|uniref:Uncharacterized protein n=1 Tax=Niastella yeongjuensis TaxID=354355 RepID=A0A1V9F3G1_9BACT|nr:hypothetical protein [Niastella yeongjuensis]OQP52786.1 hypothetical protein A4H97_24095 [Niastella yeongjuensis]SEP19738.1 hypothetical protein SAMN05660816_04707 [Niastella yeongjuensis]
MQLKTGKEEIVCLLTKVLEHYELQTGHAISRNSNRKNYEEVAKMLSEISNNLPHTAGTLQHEVYPPDYNPKNLEYPFRKYDITGNQIKDAYFNRIVANPRSFLVDACYIYLYGVGRKGFEANPVDADLLVKEEASEPETRPAVVTLVSPAPAKVIPTKIFWPVLLLLLLAMAFMYYQWNQASQQLITIKKDMQLLPYVPTQAEIDSLEGIWLCYTGSPQARISDNNRYHMVVSNVLDVKYKDGYFTFSRYGASFDHVGYMQFEAPWLVSIRSSVKNNKDSIESPRHSLMRLNTPGPFLPVISASWNFDIGPRNQIIGIREVYEKQGSGGKVEEVINTLENASCRCKVINWYKGTAKVKSFYLRNGLLDSVPNETLKKLLDENSILLPEPKEGIILQRQ